MASNSKFSDISNWYSGGSGYTMQPRQEAVKAPQPSQIPGLGDRSSNDKGGPQSGPKIRDTDSDYIKLAKRGGRSDLLYDEPRLDSVDSKNSATRRQHPSHQRADWFYHEDLQQNSQTTAQPKMTSGVLTSIEDNNPNQDQFMSGNYEQHSFDDSYGNGRPSLNQQMMDYDGYSGYQPRSEYGHSAEQNSSAAQSHLEYGKNALTGAAQHDLASDVSQRLASDYGRHQGTSAYDQSMDYGVGRDQSSLSRRPPSGYEQRLTGDYLREQEVAGRQSSVTQGQNFIADRNQSRGAGVAQSPFAADRTGSAYSSVSHSDYSLHRPSNASATNNNGSSHMKSSPSASMLNDSNHHHVNRMKRELSAQSDMSKLLSFGYLDDAKSGVKPAAADVSRQYTPDRRAASRDDLSAADYQSRLSSATRISSAAGSQGRMNRSASQDVVWPASNTPAVQDYASRRKPVEDNRPDFFHIGSQGDQSTAKPPQYGRRKASVDSVRPDFFSQGSAYEPSAGATVGGNRAAYGKTKREQEDKPDFFNIGGANLRSPAPTVKQFEDDDSLDSLDRVAGYGLPPAGRNNFRKQKMDPNVGVRHTSPTRSTAK